MDDLSQVLLLGLVELAGKVHYGWVATVGHDDPVCEFCHPATTARTRQPDRLTGPLFEGRHHLGVEPRQDVIEELPREVRVRPLLQLNHLLAATIRCCRPLEARGNCLALSGWHGVYPPCL